MSLESVDVCGSWLNEKSTDTSSLHSLCERKTDPASVPLAADIVQESPIYEGDCIRRAAVSDDGHAPASREALALQHEWAQALLSGAGGVAIRHAVDDLDPAGQGNRYVQCHYRKRGISR